MACLSNIYTLLHNLTSCDSQVKQLLCLTRGKNNAFLLVKASIKASGVTYQANVLLCILRVIQLGVCLGVKLHRS